jgi:protein-tyrosine phosphatase
MPKRNPNSKPIPAKGKGAETKKSVGKYQPWCYESHPAIDIGGGVFYGGSCNRPVVEDADIYIAFDYGHQPSSRSLPWTPGWEFEFRVKDHHAPNFADTDDYIRLVEWTLEQLQGGARVHAGCIGGHGRTGMFLAALVGSQVPVPGQLSPIAWVREHYCQRAVESKDQIAFLAKHFGCEVNAKPSKVTPPKKSWESNSKVSGWSSPVEKYRDRYGVQDPLPLEYDDWDSIVPSSPRKNIWGSTLDPEDI